MTEQRNFLIDHDSRGGYRLRDYLGSSGVPYSSLKASDTGVPIKVTLVPMFGESTHNATQNSADVVDLLIDDSTIEQGNDNVPYFSLLNTYLTSCISSEPCHKFHLKRPNMIKITHLWKPDRLLFPQTQVPEPKRAYFDESRDGAATKIDLIGESQILLTTRFLDTMQSVLLSLEVFFYSSYLCFRHKSNRMKTCWTTSTAR
jgi:hypothetical protein